jgi:hypothetical protein
VTKEGVGQGTCHVIACEFILEGSKSRKEGGGRRAREGALRGRGRGSLCVWGGGGVAEHTAFGQSLNKEWTTPSISFLLEREKGCQLLERQETVKEGKGKRRGGSRGGTKQTVKEGRGEGEARGRGTKHIPGPRRYH